MIPLASAAMQHAPGQPIARFAPANLRAGLWSLRALRAVRAALPSRGVESAAEVPPPPRSLPAAAERGVGAVLHRRRASCLERALVLQAWHAAHGDPRELVIGVTAPGDEFRAHAWLEGEDPCHGSEGDFAEILRRPPAPV